MGDVILYVDGDHDLILSSYSSAAITALCRICHEGEFESCKSLEAPCACSGTVKVWFPISDQHSLHKKKKNWSYLLLIMIPGSSSFLFFFSAILLHQFHHTRVIFIILWFRLFHFSVCAQRLHTEMVRWKRKYNLWNLFTGSGSSDQFPFYWQSFRELCFQVRIFSIISSWEGRLNEFLRILSLSFKWE